MEKEEIVVVKPGEGDQWDPISECPFPLAELTPPYPLSPEDRVVIEAHSQE